MCHGCRTKQHQQLADQRGVGRTTACATNFTKAASWGESTYHTTGSTLLPDSLELVLGSPTMGLPTTTKDPPSSQLGAWEGHW